MAAFFERIADDLLVFALDDYLLTAPVDGERVAQAHRAIAVGDGVVAARLCQSEFYEPNEYVSMSEESWGPGMFRLRLMAVNCLTEQAGA